MVPDKVNKCKIINDATDDLAKQFQKLTLIIEQKSHNNNSVNNEGNSSHQKGRVTHRGNWSR